jgi:hypothetical protein
LKPTTKLFEVLFVACAAAFEHDSEHNYDGLGSKDTVPRYLLRELWV